MLTLVPVLALEGQGADAPTVTGETGYFTLFTGNTVPQGEWSFGLYYNNWDRVVIPDGGAIAIQPGFSSEWDYDWNRLSASVGYGITDDFELTLMLPYEDFDSSDNNRFGRINNRFYTNNIDASGLGNLRLGGKWRVHENGDNRLALNAFVEFPTGDDDEGVVTGDTGFGAGLAYQHAKWVFNLGYRDPGDPDFVTVPEEVIAGVGYAATVSDRLDWITEFVGTIHVGDKPAPDDAYDLTTGGRLWFGEAENWAFNFAFRTNVEHLSDTDEFCPIGGLLGLTFFPRGPSSYALTVDLQGNGDGAVTSNPVGIDCSTTGASDCDEIYRKGTMVALSAVPAAGSEFKGWSGDPDCSDGSVTMDDDRHCIATFEEVPEAPAPPPPPPPPAPKPPTPPPPPPVIEEVCQFGSGSTRVDNICKAKLDEVALRMKNEGERVALVIGHSDSQGSESWNRTVGMKRAQAVKDYLVNRHGIDSSRITVESRGESEPAGDNTTAAGRAENRRAVIILKVM